MNNIFRKINYWNQLIKGIEFTLSDYNNCNENNVQLMEFIKIFNYKYPSIEFKYNWKKTLNNLFDNYEFSPEDIYSLFNFIINKNKIRNTINDERDIYIDLNIIDEFININLNNYFKFSRIKKKINLSTLLFNFDS
jgi:hypothetical protein